MRRVEATARDLRAELAAADAESLHGEAALLVRELFARDVVAAEPAAGPVDLRRIPRIGEGGAERFYRFVRELIRLVDDEQFLPTGARLEGGSVIVTGEHFRAIGEATARSPRLNRARCRWEESPAGCRSELRFELPRTPSN